MWGFENLCSEKRNLYLIVSYLYCVDVTVEVYSEWYFKSYYCIFYKSGYNLLYYQCCDKTKIKSLYLQQTYDNYSSLDSMFGFVQEKYKIYHNAIDCDPFHRTIVL